MDKQISSFKRALVSTSNKEGLAEFLKPMQQKGLEIVSTGGTANYLRQEGLDVIDVSEQTGFPEVMGGRVKTLHPKIHMCLLARDYVEEDSSILKDYNIQPFDLVIGNLYPFEQAKVSNEAKGRDLYEFIDIGGPSFLRAAAKSFERITVLCDPKDYSIFHNKKIITLDERRHLASKVFAHVSVYDSMVAKELGIGITDPEFSVGGGFVEKLRYGENPVQNASWYRGKGESSGLHNALILQGKPLSYNNILDIDAAVTTIREFNKPTCVAVKHLNPCGVATSDNISEATIKALKADPVSVFGGVIAVNQMLNQEAAEALVEGFVECVIAPDFSKKALEVLSVKKNLRVLKWPEMMTKDQEVKVRTVSGGFLVQTQDEVSSWSEKWDIIGDTPNDFIKSNIEFAWKVCAHLKSNAIALVSDHQTVGLGMGQVNRVDAVEQAIGRQLKHHTQAKGLVLASDAFFPFPDSIEQAHKAGIEWVVQPGGSIRDEQVIAKSKSLGVNLVMTGQRHFQH